MDIDNELVHISGPETTKTIAMQKLETMGYPEKGHNSLIDKAKILREIGKSLGRPRSSSSGDSQGALKSYEKSLEMLKQAAANNPSDERALLELASTYDLLGEMYEQAGEFQQAMNYYTDSMSIRQKLAKIDLLGSSYTKIGDIRESRENWVGASKMFKRNLEIKKEALSKDPKNLKLKQQACTVYTRIAEFMAKLGELYQEIDEDFAVKFFEKAIIYNQKMIDIVRESVATEPKNPSYERYMAGCLLQQGAVVFKTGKYAESRLHLSKALEIFEKHAKNDEQNIDLKWKLARNYGYFGESLLEAGQLDKAIVFLNRSVSILSDCVKRDSANRWFREDIEQFHYFLVIGYLRKNDPSALSAMQAFLQMYKDTSYVIPPETNHTLEFLRKTRGLYKEIYRKKLDSHLLDILKESFYWYKQNVSMKRKLEQVEYAFTLLTLEGKEAKEQEVLSIIKGCEKSLKQKDVIAQFRLSQIYSLLGEKEHGKKIYKTVHALLEKELEGI
ncbi:MAG: tetratricopeptide repeat protein [Blastocatellia bacterium]|nr:tetratricopeptide repeat protein [Blastocatellia bacterium]